MEKPSPSPSAASLPFKKRFKFNFNTLECASTGSSSSSGPSSSTPKKVKAAMPSNGDSAKEYCAHQTLSVIRCNVFVLEVSTLKAVQVGIKRYRSVNGHLCKQQSRKDDLDEDLDRANQAILTMKRDTLPSDLCGMPLVFARYMRNVMALDSSTELFSTFKTHFRMPTTEFMIGINDKRIHQ
ncbi:hypothetical protein TYRP_022331 [Tyrophagus putrescentiae]|nr:hypothetical protein TYRP_022331 [Tyrophagus putrescentiae]